MRYPFTLYKVTSKSGTVWHARFWDETAQKYALSRSTGIRAEGKKEHRREAEEAARRLFDELATAKPTATVAQGQTPQGIPASPAARKTIASTPLIEYLSSFWTPTSEYAQYKRDVHKKPLAHNYIEMNHEDVRRHVQPFPGFADITVEALNKAILKKWMIWLAGRKATRRKKDGTVIEGDTISGRRANTILQSVRVAIRWAVDNDEIPVDPFRRLGEVSETAKEKGVLTFEERNTLTHLPVSDYRSRLVMLLGSFCGLRRGEMRGLQWGDITDGIITVQHNFLDKEGLKKPKCNSTRKVPIPRAVQKILDMAREYAPNASPESYILESPLTPGQPLCNNFFRDGVTRELSGLGITPAQQRERILTCHSLRHTFITLAQLSGISDVEIRALAGQKSAKVMNRYSHVPQVIDFDEARKKLESFGANQPKASNG